MSTAKRGLILNQGYGLHYKYGKLGITNGQWMTVLFFWICLVTWVPQLFPFISLNLLPFIMLRIALYIFYLY